MATLSQKPADRYAISDWFTSNNNISTTAERQRYSSHDVRQDSKGLVNLTTNKTKWDQHDNNTKLDDRIVDLKKWKTALERCLKDLNFELDHLGRYKLETEQSLEEKGVWVDVVAECLTLRESRRNIDLVRDSVESELTKESELIKKVKEMLQKRISEAFQELGLLREARHQVIHDIEDKTEAINIDDDCYNMDNNSAYISYKPNPIRVVKDSTTQESWFQFSRYNKERADREILASITLRELIEDTLAMVKNELEAQRTATEFEYRKRIHEMERAKGELEWQEEKTKEEIADIEEQIRKTEQAIRDKENFLKVAHTRLETRTYRPNIELCRDIAQDGITGEVRQLEGTITTLRNKLKEEHHARYNMYRHLYRIQEDIICKKNSLALDNKCMDVRRKLVVPADKYVAEIPDDNFKRAIDRESTPLHPIKTEQLALA